MALIGLLGALELSHSFLRNYGETGLNFYDRGLVLASFGAYKWDYWLLNRFVDEGRGTISTLPRSGRDTTTLSLSGRRRSEYLSGVPLRDMSLDLNLQARRRLLPGRQSLALGGVLHQYDIVGGSEDNSGFSASVSEALGRARALALLSGEVERKRLSGKSAAEVGLNLAGLVRAGGSLSEERYPLSAGEERKFTGVTYLRSALSLFGVRLTDDVEYDDGRYALNTLKSSALLSNAARAELDAELFGTRFVTSMTREVWRDDYKTYSGDEVGSRSGFEFEAERSRRSLRLRFFGSVFVDRYDYPEGVRNEDRDERKAKLGFVEETPLSSNALVEFGLGWWGTDIIYVDESRSASNRVQKKYSAFSRLTLSGPVSADLRNELSAVYLTYTFDSLDNLLLRYFESRLLLSAARATATFRLRFQDRGLYFRGIYQPSLWTREHWVSPSLRLLRVFGTDVYAVSDYYVRYNLSADRWSVGVTESGVGLKTAGRYVSGLVERFTRSDESPYWKLSLLYSLK